MSMLMKHHLRCQYSGLVIGTLEVKTTFGTLPYLSHWDRCVVRHPVFAMDTQRLLKFTKDEWTRLATRITEEDIAEDESDILRVSYLAVLHTLDCVKQDFPALPSLALVHSTISKLFALAWWKHYLESERFRFPTLHISRYNHNTNFENLPDYLELCFDIRRDYENKKHEREEAEKIRQAEKAVIALNSQWVTPASKRLLWGWVKAHLPSEYQPDCEGWLSTLFLGGSGAILEFEEDDINLAEELIVSHCPAGTGVMFAVRQRLEVIRKTWEQHHKAYEIELEEYAPGANTFVNGQRVTAPDPGPEPQPEQFNSKALYYVAHAKWQIAKRAFDKGEGQ